MNLQLYAGTLHIAHNFIVKTRQWCSTKPQSMKCSRSKLQIFHYCYLMPKILLFVCEKEKKVYIRAHVSSTAPTTANFA